MDVLWCECSEEAVSSNTVVINTVASRQVEAFKEREYVEEWRAKFNPLDDSSCKFERYSLWH